MPYDFRHASETDRETLRRLTVEAFEGVSIDHAIDRVLGPIAEGDWRLRKGKHLDEDLDAIDGEILVVESEGRVLGFVSMRFDRESKVGRIPNLVVSSAAKNQGIGRMLLNAAVDRFRAEGMTVAKIETLEHNPVGRHLYPSVGFVEVARQVHYAMDVRGGNGDERGSSRRG